MIYNHPFECSAMSTNLLPETLKYLFLSQGIFLCIIPAGNVWEHLPMTSASYVTPLGSLQLRRHIFSRFMYRGKFKLQIFHVCYWLALAFVRCATRLFTTVTFPRSVTSVCNFCKSCSVSFTLRVPSEITGCTDVVCDRRRPVTRETSRHRTVYHSQM